MCLQRIRCDQICPDLRGDACRPDELDTLVESIRLHGVLRPVLVRPASNGYVIVHGERRWRAARKAGLKDIPALIVQDISGAESASVVGGVRQAGWLLVGR